MNEVGKVIDRTLIQGACDFSGISREAYASIFKIIKEAFGQLHVRKFPIPRPFQIRLERDVLNKGMQNVIGIPFHINEIYNSKSGNLSYNSTNNLFVDLNHLLRFIVKFYNITSVSMSKLILVVKLDESEVIKGQKLERVSITLMNGALSNATNSRDLNFSVQSENNIWWLACFQVKNGCYSCAISFGNCFEYIKTCDSIC